MSKRGIPGLKKRFRTTGAFEWHIDKRIKGFGRLCESNGTSDEESFPPFSRNAWISESSP